MEMNWQNLFKGVRNKLNASQSELSEEIDISRRQISKYETEYRTPNKEAREEIIGFIEDREMKTEDIQKDGDTYEKPEGLRNVEEKDIEIDSKTAELLGIIIGDGEIKKDGAIRVSFNPHNEREYIEDRTIKLLRRISDNEIRFESEKRIEIHDRGLVLALEKIGLNPGSKFENEWTLNEQITSKEGYRRAILRGLFDTDGTFYFDGQRTSIEYGRFSDRSKEIVELIEKLLDKDEIKYQKTQNKDSRWKIRISDTKYVRKFFYKIGSSNYKHIIRYLSWRENRKPITVSGKELQKISDEAEIGLENIDIPFKSESKKDREIIVGEKFRNKNKVADVVEEIFDRDGYSTMTEALEVNKRTIRKWRNGKRTPSPQKSFKLKQILEA